MFGLLFVNNCPFLLAAMKDGQQRLVLPDMQKTMAVRDFMMTKRLTVTR